MAHKIQKADKKRRLKAPSIFTQVNATSNSGFAVSSAKSPEHGEKAHELFKLYYPFYQSPPAKMEIIRSGLQAAAITDFIRLAGISQLDLAHILSLAEPTLRKYIKEGKKLSPDLTEHLIQLFELFDKGMDTFGSLQEFKNWLPHHNIGIDAKPVDLLDTVTGINMVMTELRRIDYGILA